jgi:hypothetical protein
LIRYPAGARSAAVRQRTRPSSTENWVSQTRRKTSTAGTCHSKAAADDLRVCGAGLLTPGQARLLDTRGVAVEPIGRDPLAQPLRREGNALFTNASSPSGLGSATLATVGWGVK